MISGITITCFAASYAVCWLLEVSRLAFQASVRNLVMRAFAAAGFLAHTLFLYVHAQAELAGGMRIPLSNWHDFCLLAAWVLAGAYLGLSFRRPQFSVGIFLLPLVLALIGVGRSLSGATPFTPGEATSYWRWIHGVALLLGTAGVTLGFATGVMHLIQSYRLKNKLPPHPRFRLPSLEWLQRFNRESLFLSAGLLAIGLIAGVILNFDHRLEHASGVPWTHPVVVSSGVLFLWLCAVLVFEACYKPAREGRKVAYLTVGSFVFLGLVLYFVLFFEHASGMGAVSHQWEGNNAVAGHRL
jgi:hypothetical protein